MALGKDGTQIREAFLFFLKEKCFLVKLLYENPHDLYKDSSAKINKRFLRHKSSVLPFEVDEWGVALWVLFLYTRS